MTVDLRLLPAALLTWLACGLLVGLPDAALPVAIGLFILAGTAGVLLLARRRAARSTGPPFVASAVVAAAVAGLALVSLAVNDPIRSPAELEGRTTSGTAVLEITGDTVNDLGAAGAGGIAQRSRVRAELVSISARDRVIRAHAPVLVFGDPEALGDARIGARIELAVTLRPADPGEDVAFLAFARGQVTSLSPPAGVVGWADDLRAGFSTAAQALPGAGGSLLPGLAIGDVSELEPGLDEAMKLSSLSHLTAVSGANCAVVVAAIMLLGARLGMGRRIRILTAGVALVGFVILVTPQPSVLRAAVMAAVVLVSLASGRVRAGLPTLSIAVIALLVSDPWLARSYGLALSALATAGLLLLARPIEASLSRWLPAPLALAIAVPLSAQLACQPVIVLLDPSLPLLSVPANLLAEPAAPVATLIGLIACLLLPLVPPLGELLLRIAWLPSAWIAAIAQFFAAHPEGRLPWFGDLLGLALMTVLVAILARAFVRHRWRLAAAMLTIAVVAASGIAVGSVVGRERAQPQGWEVASCDIGQGDASVVRSRGRFALIDTGADAPALLSCLDDLGATRIDMLVLTHFDLDHVGAASAVIGRVDLVLHGLPDGPAAERLLAQLAAGGAEVRQVFRGASGQLGGVRWRALWPPANPHLEPGNGAGVVLRTDGTLRAIFLADLGEDAQRSLVRAGGIGPVDVVKVAHHGSADQFPRLYAQLGARVALVSCGRDNTYGHPTASLLAILRDTHGLVLRTDLEGELLVAAADGALRTWTERAPDADPATAVGPAT